MLSVAEIGRTLAEAGRLQLRPLCIYSSDSQPEGVFPSYTIDRCIARAIYASALWDHTPSMYISADHEQCCGGGKAWLGFQEPHLQLKYFVTVGTPDFRGGAAEHLKASPRLFEEQKQRAGKITPPGKYLVIGPCDASAEAYQAMSVIIFGGCEQIRNLCGLAQFSSSDPFFKTLFSGWPTCAGMITYPAGMAANAPKDTAYVGPTDPTGNMWLPPDLMVMGIPMSLAGQMAEDAGESFIGKRGRIAYPEHRIAVQRPEIAVDKSIK